MAIAYYVPDQAKLAEKQKPKVIKAVKIPLNNYTLSNNTCWDLMAQVFSYALRYHYLTAGAGNGVLQISVEFIQQPSSTSQQPPANTPPSESMKSDDHQHGKDDVDGDGKK